MATEKKCVLVGDIKMSNTIAYLYNDGTIPHQEVMFALQSFMMKYGVVKIDVCLDPFSIDNTNELRNG